VVPKKIEEKKLATDGLIKERKTSQHWCKNTGGLVNFLLLLLPAELTLANCFNPVSQS
jgi:hypothetical protein